LYNNVDVTIEIYSEQYRTNDLSIVDNISSQILNILMINTSIPVLPNANFQIFPKERTSSVYSSLVKGDNFIARKIITINNLVNQIS
jgi:ACT domain-containing protein